MDHDTVRPTSSEIGDRGERIAAEFLEREGYRIVVANFTAPIGRNGRGVQVKGEIDIVALDGDILCFVEVKASQFGRGSKANHLAYVGDSRVGSDVNNGAGTITCNYDGANKHRTVIEDDVHIGSNCVLVAPVTIGKGGTVGAGSTISKDTAPGVLSVARGRQASITGWQRPRKAPK